MQQPNNKLIANMTSLVITQKTISKVIVPQLKRKRHISFFDGEGFEKPRPESTVTYDRINGDVLSIKSFAEERNEEQKEYKAWLENKKRIKLEKEKEKASKTAKEDLDDALSILSFIPLSMENLSIQTKNKDSN